MMENNLNIIGNQQIQKQIIELFIKKKLPQSLIFNGIQGIGKYTYAITLAKIILSYNITDIPSNIDNIFLNQDVCKSVDINSCSNLLIIKPHYDEKSKSYKDIITIEEIRKINDFLHLTSINNKYRIIIIDALDQLNINASNALLKIIEEPPKNTIFLLISHNINKILDTILSRCFILKFNKLNSDELNHLITLNNISLNEDNKKNYLQICNGSFAKFLFLVNDDKNIYSSLINILNNKNTDLEVYNFINNLKISEYKNINFLFDIIYTYLCNKECLSYKHQQTISKVSKFKNITTPLNLDKYSVLANILLSI